MSLMKLNYQAFLLGIFCIFSYLTPKDPTKDSLIEKKIVIVSASYNNIKWAQAYLDSVISQTYNNFRIIYYDDASTDGTAEFVQKYAASKNFNKIHLVRNKVRVGPHLNIYRAIHSCDDDEIICILDGDDWFAHEQVLTKLNAVYTNPDVWLTYGSYKKYVENKLGISRQLPKEVIEKNSIRDYPWVTSHLRTFYSWLYKRIAIEDLIVKGSFIPYAGDMAIMFPMIEMAGNHALFIKDVLMIYNNANELNFNKILKDKNAIIKNTRYKIMENYLRKRKRYEKLEQSDLEIQQNVDQSVK